MSTKRIRICCDGGNASPHPKVFITFKRNEKVVKCSYCEKSFSREKTEQVKKTD